MITAVDSCVLLDVFGASAEFGERSRDAMRRAVAEGGLIACSVVWAEVAAAFPAAFPTASPAREAMGRLGVEFSPLADTEALAAGQAWREYRRRGGTRDRVVADFLIGAHAQTRADRLLTRDRGFYRSYFRRLRLLDPAIT
jgi:predicted nucleic acid-binding protein